MIEGSKVKLLCDFETRQIPVMKDGKPVMKDGKAVTETVPKFLKGKSFSVVKMDMFWLGKEEFGGTAAMLAPMDYVRLTYPDGTKTKYYELFELMQVEVVV